MKDLNKTKIKKELEEVNYRFDYIWDIVKNKVDFSTEAKMSCLGRHFNEFLEEYEFQQEENEFHPNKNDLVEIVYSFIVEMQELLPRVI